MTLFAVIIVSFVAGVFCGGWIMYEIAKEAGKD